MKPLSRCSTISPSPTVEPPHTDNGYPATEDHAETSSSSASLSSRRVIRGRVARTRIRPRVLRAPRGGRDSRQWGDADLALPLGMSFAAILAQVLNKTNIQGEKHSLEQFTKMCTSAVKESITNIYGDKYDYFAENFEKSFRSTIKTLHLISQTPSLPESDNGNFVNTPNSRVEEITNFNNPPPCVVPTPINTQLILHNNDIQNQLSNISNNNNNYHMLNTLERQLTEQVRSNNLKEFEMGLIMKKLELKQTQLNINSHSNMMERVKIKMGMAKYLFKEEKLKNQMEDARFSDLIKRFIDLLITGLIIMSCCFGYGTYVFSYQRIKDATEACSTISKESNSWWVPKQVSNINTSWLFIRCHVISFSRLIFSILIILVISWLIIQKSSINGRNMPITFNLTVLSIFCGFWGKWSVDSLGGDGILWLAFWELLCGIHFLGNMFPAEIYRILYGNVGILGDTGVGRIVTYRIRRWVLYFVLLVVLPVSAGLFPFASFGDWIEHFKEKFSFFKGNGEGEL